MHLRVSTVRRKEKTYRYAQLVESYRRPDGMPAHRVLSSLGQLSDLEIDNLRLALAESRGGRAVVVQEKQRNTAPEQFIQANLRFLDIAVLLSLWNEWGLGSLLESLTTMRDVEAPLADVVSGLVVHRAIDPGSKLHAQRWYPTTALPELSAVSPGKFNNTRIHRVLAELERVDAELQERLADRCHGQVSFSALFLDVSDTWFVGQGPDLAQKGKTKEGMVRRKIGIVLLVNESGFPLRWTVVGGKSYDAHVMQSIIDSIAECDWAMDVPLVCDRIMGRKSSLGKMAGSGLKFVTAIPAGEFDTYTDRIPHEHFTCQEPELNSDSLEEDLRLAVCAAREAGLQQLPGDDLVFYQDLGIISKEARGMIDPGAEHSYSWEKTAVPPCVMALTEARAISEALEGPDRLTYADIAAKHGKNKQWVYARMKLLRLSDDIQEAILSGYGSNVGIRRLLDLVTVRDPQKQREAFEELVKASLRAPRTQPVQTGVRGRSPVHKDGEPVRIRAVVGFNAQYFIDTRRLAEEKLQKVYAFLRELNLRLQNPRSRLTADAAVTKAEAKMKAMDLSDAVQIHTAPGDDSGDASGIPQLRATLLRRPWNARRRYDGFVLIAAAPDLTMDGEQLYRLYRAKDAVEKDFQVIKSVLKVRPVRHRTDQKVKGHVTLCMLALLLERTLRQKLLALPSIGSAQAALEILGTCHLNLCQHNGAPQPYYTATKPNKDQKAILRTLKMEHLVEDHHLAQEITPRT